MKKILLCLAAATAFTGLPTVAQAQDSTLSFNVGAVTDYRYRGISQTRLKPALQGGVDFGLANGLYVGAWASTIKWIKDFGGDANVELDLYGGYKGTLSEGLGFDVGVLTYQYPSNDLNPSANTTEIYGALSFGPATLKYSHSTTNLFGFADSKGSGYLDLTANFDVGNGFTVTPHIGHQKVKNNDFFSYTDYSLGVSKDFAGFLVSAAIVGTETDSAAGVPAYASPANGKDLGKAGIVVGVKKNF